MSLRSSAYLRVLCVKNYLNAENAEIRRGPQANRLLLAAFTTAATFPAVFAFIFALIFSFVFAFVFLALLLFLLFGSGQAAEGHYERGVQGFGTVALQYDGNSVGDILASALAFVFLPLAIRLAGHKFLLQG